MALRDQPYIPLYVLDFLSDERLRECSAESVGVYIMLMCVMHKSENYGTVVLKEKYKQDADDVTAFAKMLRRQLPYDVDVIKRSLDDLIENEVLMLDGNVLYQKRMVHDGEVSVARAAAGAKNKKRIECDAQKPEPKSNEEPKVETACEDKTSTIQREYAELELEQTYIIDNEETQVKQAEIAEISEISEPVEIPKPKQAASKPESKSDKKSLMEERFDIFWKAFPRKMGKGEAKKAFLKVSPNEELFNKILSAVECGKQCEQWRKDKGRYIPYPATWLNQGRWDDDYGEVDFSSMGRHPPAEDFDPEDPFAAWRNE